MLYKNYISIKLKEKRNRWELRLLIPLGSKLTSSFLCSNTLATWCEELTLLKRPWCWQRLTVGGEGDDRAWDGWMASLTQWTRVWVNSGSWWWTGRPGMLQSMGSQRGGHDWVTELSWTDIWDDKCSLNLLWQSFNFKYIKNIFKSNHYVVHLKHLQCCMTNISQ